jgi:hypothetical protein
VDDCKNLPDYETLTLRIHHTPKLDFGNLQKRSCFIKTRPERLVRSVKILSDSDSSHTKEIPLFICKDRRELCDAGKQFSRFSAFSIFKQHLKFVKTALIFSLIADMNQSDKLVVGLVFSDINSQYKWQFR